MKLTAELVLPDTDPDFPHARAIPAGPDWKFSTELQEGELFYRTKLTGALSLSGDDFAWLYAQWSRFPCCVECELNVFSADCATDGQARLFWPGYFNMASVRWDFSACTAQVQNILPRDGYDALYRVWETPVNLLAENPQRVPFTALYREHYVNTIDADGNQTIGPPDGNLVGDGYQNLEHHYRAGIRLSYALNYLLTQTVANTKASFISGLISSFYFATVNPVTRRKNLDKLLLAGSDAKRPASVTPAVRLMTSLKELLEELRSLHNVYYLLDGTTGYLRLEHQSWFAQLDYQPTRRVGLNLLPFAQALKAANNESVDLENLYGVEELIISNNSASFFGEYKTGSVRYEDGCTLKDDKGEVKKNTITVSKIWTDLYAGYSSPESVPDDSIFLCDVVPAGTIPQVQSSYAQLAIASTNSEYPDYASVLAKIGTNGYQSAALLFIDFHRHGRSFTQGLVNAVKQPDGSYADGLRMAMLSTSNTRRQEGIVIPICCTDLPLKLDGYVKSNRFEFGKLDKGVFDPAADTLTLDVVADSRCQRTQVSPPDPGADCPPRGTVLSSYTEQTYCSQSEQEQVVKTNTQITVYADGACGSYQEAGPTISTGNC